MRELAMSNSSSLLLSLQKKKALLSAHCTWRRITPERERERVGLRGEEELGKCRQRGVGNDSRGQLEKIRRARA